MDVFLLLLRKKSFFFPVLKYTEYLNSPSQRNFLDCLVVVLQFYRANSNLMLKKEDTALDSESKVI